MKRITRPRWLNPETCWAAASFVTLFYIWGKNPKDDIVWYFNNSLIILAAAPLFASSWVACMLDGRLFHRIHPERRVELVKLILRMLLPVACTLANLRIYLQSIPYYQRAYEHPNPDYANGSLSAPTPPHVGWVIFWVSLTLPILISLIHLVPERRVDASARLPVGLPGWGDLLPIGGGLIAGLSFVLLTALIPFVSLWALSAVHVL